MDILDSIKMILKQQVSVDELLKEAREAIRQSCWVETGDYYPIKAPKSESQVTRGILAHHVFVDFLRGHGLLLLAESFLLDWWLELGKIQTEHKKQVYMSAAANQLTLTYFMLGDKGSALRWALLTHASDALYNYFEGNGGYTLRNIFGLPRDTVGTLERIATQHQTTITQHLNDDWSHPEGFPEHAVIKFFQNPSVSSLLCEQTLKREYFLSPYYLNTLTWKIRELDKKHKRAKLPAEKGKLSGQKGAVLEFLALYLSLLLPGCVPRERVVDREKVGEHDIVVHNLTDHRNITVELFERHILIECKNWTEKVAPEQVGYFIERMNLAHAKFGIILTQNGITEPSHRLIRRAFQEHDTICIVIKNSDFKQLADREKTLWWLLFEKIEEFRFGKAKNYK
jgi:hypothetical protein